jgi:uncharacterized protein
MIEQHNLAQEFPEFKETIHTLKMNDNHFAKLFDEYHATDREIRRLELGVEASSDTYLENLKKKRVHTKDVLYSLLKKSG